MPVPHKEATSFDILTDRWGDVHAAALPAADRAAVARLVPMMFEEITFVARDTRTGAYGLLAEAREMSHAGSEDGEQRVRDDYRGHTVNGTYHDGTTMPSKEDVVAEHQANAEALKERWPALDVWIASGDPVFLDRVSLQAFIPEGSELLADGEAIGRAMNGHEAPVPTF